MRNQKSKNKHHYCGTLFLVVFLLLVASHFSLCDNVFPEEKKESQWSGVDESVVEKYAKEYGREARESLINTDQGDLLLFVFLLAGTVGGFVGGYYWRILMVEKVPGICRKEQKIGD